MRAIRAARAVTCIALASALCVPAVAAQFDYFLKIDGVDGESTADKGHKNEIEILSWSWGASQPASAHHGGGMGAGKVSSRDFSVAPEPEAGKVSKVEAIGIKQTTAPSDGEAEITLKGQAAEAKKLPGRVRYGDITLKRGVTDESAATASGGVSVAAGDVDGDGAAEAKHKSVRWSISTATSRRRLGNRPQLDR